MGVEWGEGVEHSKCRGCFEQSTEWERNAMDQFRWRIGGDLQSVPKTVPLRVTLWLDLSQTVNLTKLFDDS